MSNTSEISGYRWQNAKLNHSHGFLLPKVLPELARLRAGLPGGGASV